MKDTKNRFEIFSFYDHTGIAEHLTQMAPKGWLLEKISGFGWTYRRIYSIVLLSFGMMGIITFGILHASRKGLFDRDTDTYEYNGTTFTVYMDELPLTIEELTGVSYEGGTAKSEQPVSIWSWKG